MAQEGAVGVVDDVDGTLWGNVSPWDLKFLNHHSLISLALPVETFLHHVREKMVGFDHMCFFAVSFALPMTAFSIDDAGRLSSVSHTNNYN